MEDPQTAERFDWTDAFECAQAPRLLHEPPLPDAREVLRLADLERLGLLAPETF